MRRGPAAGVLPGQVTADLCPEQEKTFSAKAPTPGRRPHTGQEQLHWQLCECLEGEAQGGCGGAGPGLPRTDAWRPGGAGRARRRGGAGGGRGPGADVTAAPPGPPERGRGCGAAGPARGRRWRASGLTAEFELVLRLEAQDRLHLRHVPRQRGTSGGETPERSPGARSVKAAPPLNLEKGGAGRGAGGGRRRGARGGGGLRGAGAGAEGEGEAAVPGERTARTHAATHAATHARTHARTQQAGLLGPGARSGCGELSARGAPAGQCASAALAVGAGRPGGRGRGAAQSRGGAGPGRRESWAVAGETIY